MQKRLEVLARFGKRKKEKIKKHGRGWRRVSPRKRSSSEDQKTQIYEKGKT